MTLGIVFVTLALVTVPEPDAPLPRADDPALTREATARVTKGEAREEQRLEREERQREREESRRDREDDRYERGTEALDDGAWDAAIDAFDSVIEAKGRRADGALYWKAYARNKQGQREEALKLLGELARAYPQSRWIKEAKALEVEVRQQAGQPTRPESVADEDLKLMAIGGLLHTDAERAIPMLEKLLQGGASRKVQERALFVLSQSSSPRAKEIVVRIAKGDGQPDLQHKAIRQLGVFGGRESRQALVEIYATSPDRQVKKAVLKAFLVAGEKDRVVEAARTEKDPELRRDAIQTLGVMGGLTELWGMYQAETVPETRKAILQSLAVGGGVDRLLEVARTEKDPDLRKDAIRKLGVFGGKRGADAVIELYRGESDRGVREAALQALFIQGNARALIEVARTEKDLELKKRAVSHLSHMGSKEATDFLIEILDK